MRKAIRLAVLTMALGGCSFTTPPTSVHQPMSARPEPRLTSNAANGAIYQAGVGRPLFEDRRARFVGDTLTINLTERTQATQTVDVSVPTILGFPGKSFQGMNIKADSASNFAGKGDSDAKHDFIGTLTVTVIEVLPNGNLLVSGEKQVAINQGDEFIRFSGVVNPNTISGLNTVTSTQVADARIEYKANGYIDSAQVMGWLARFFLTVLPF
jgi:flagellar L-ring protein FlgH